MSRQEHNLTVRTGGDAGQILDHLLCATDPQVQRDYARALLAPVARLRERIAELEREVEMLSAPSVSKVGLSVKMTQEEFDRLCARIAELEREATGLRAEIAGAHGALKLSGVPEQIPPFKAPLAPLAARLMFLGAERDRIQEQRDQALRELDEARREGKIAAERLANIEARRVNGLPPVSPKVQQQMEYLVGGLYEPVVPLEAGP